mmetsp:Transcript_25247/g.58120  ORF Transcript_25247/g.58120 Transcript_25247/m.58120 type:complete len:771 (+) Transcript_25247:75-2387(+)
MAAMQPVLTYGSATGSQPLTSSHFSALLSLVREAHLTEVRTVQQENQRLRTLIEDMDIVMDELGHDNSGGAAATFMPMASSKSRRDDVNKRWKATYGEAKSATFDNGMLEKVLTGAEEAQVGRSSKPRKVVRTDWVPRGRNSSSSACGSDMDEDGSIEPNDDKDGQGHSPRSQRQGSAQSMDTAQEVVGINNHHHRVSGLQPAWLGDNQGELTRRSSILRKGPKRASLSFMRGSDEARSQTQQRRSPCPGVFKVVSSPYFDTFFAVVILVNSAVIAAQAQLRGLEVGHSLGYDQVKDPGWDGEVWFDIAGWFFGIVFTIEIILRMCGFGRRFWKEIWNLFDTVIVLFWLAEVLLHNFTDLPDPALLQVLRLMKLLRLVRLFRQQQGFGALYLMTTALWGSFTILAGSAALLILVLMMLALLANQVLVETYLTKDYSIQEKLEVYEYFGTFSRALLSLFEMTLANWPPVCRLLVENVSELYLIPALVHKLTIGFAVVGIINGVFMQETLKVAATDDRIMVRQKAMAISTHIHKMEALFAKADNSGDGFLDLEEFRQVMSDKGISTWLASMDLDTTDVETLFRLIDGDDDGKITSRELVVGVSQLKGPARSIDLAVAMREQDKIQAVVAEVAVGLQAMKSALNSTTQALQAQADRERSLSSPKRTPTGGSTMKSATTRPRRQVEIQSPEASIPSRPSTPYVETSAVFAAEDRIQAALTPHKKHNAGNGADLQGTNSFTNGVDEFGAPPPGSSTSLRSEEGQLDPSECVFLNL